MINLLPRNRICSRFISTPVNVRPALSQPRSLLFLSNKFLLNADRRLCSAKRQSPALYSRLPISRSGARHAKTSSYPTKNFRQAPSISILRKSGFAVPTFSEIWLPRGAVANDQPDLSGTGRSRKVAALVISLRSDINHESDRQTADGRRFTQIIVILSAATQATVNLGHGTHARIGEFLRID
jgi:hypothetical protein